MLRLSKAHMATSFRFSFIVTITNLFTSGAPAQSLQKKPINAQASKTNSTAQDNAAAIALGHEEATTGQRLLRSMQGIDNHHQFFRSGEIG